MIQGLIFDFDGLILETEGPIYQAWQEIYQSYGCHLPLETWTETIGSAHYEFDPVQELERQVGFGLDGDEIYARQRQYVSQLILEQPPMPGVNKYLADAQELGLLIGLASSSPCEWVVGHLERLGYRDYFNTIMGSDDVVRTKPDPALFLTVLSELNLAPEEAIVLEDSPHGVAAAHQAGVFVVAVPNEMTRNLQFDHADLMLGSLNEMPLQTLIEIANNHR